MTTHTAAAPGTDSTSAVRHVDWGRTAMVPISLVLGSIALARLFVLVHAGGDGGWRAAAAGLTAVLTAAFYVLIVRAYLRRGSARATSRVRLTFLAAPIATFLPFAVPAVGSGGSPTWALVVGELLLLAGFAYAVWAVRCLDRSLSIVPQARTLIQHGPYATVRHPLYLGELVAMLGLAVTLGGPLPLVLWGVLVLLQAYRAVQEERLLRTHLPAYADYQTRTARIVPGLF